MGGVHRRVLTGVAALALAGCGADAAPREAAAPVPPGFQAVEGDGARFAVPAGWTVQRRGTVQAVGPAGTAGLPPQAVLATTPAYPDGVRGWVLLNEGELQVRFPRARRVAERALRAPGLDGRVAEYRTVHDGTELALFDVAAVGADGTAANLFLRLPAADAPRARVAEVVASLRVGGAGGGRA